MPSPAKQKGNSYESELVNQAKEVGIPAVRAWGSDGRSLGEHSEVDCVIGGFKVQAKRRKAMAKHLIPTKHVDCVATRMDRGDSLIIMRYTDWLDLVYDQDHLSRLLIRKSKGGAK